MLSTATVGDTPWGNKEGKMSFKEEKLKDWYSWGTKVLLLISDLTLHFNVEAIDNLKGRNNILIGSRILKLTILR